jgi:hypothetical protein
MMMNEIEEKKSIKKDKKNNNKTIRSNLIQKTNDMIPLNNFSRPM